MSQIKIIPDNIGDFLEYDEKSSTGLRWIKKRQKVNIGDEAGNLQTTGYYCTMFNYKTYKNHRIIFFLKHGYCPDIIDHIDNNTENNRIDNLREATICQNEMNTKLSNRNTSGIKGLRSYENKCGREYWMCEITSNGKKQTNYLRKDSPNSFENAKSWLLEKRLELHGEFFNQG